MSTLIFVHGISVRDSECNPIFGWLTEGISKIRPGVAVRLCYWGGAHGATLHAGGASIPESRPTDDKPGETAGADEDPVALWAGLAEDPAWQLRLLGALVPRPAPVPPGGVSPGVELLRRARALPSLPALAARLSAWGLDAEFVPSVTVVLDLAATRSALRATAELGGALNLALARAIVAVTLIRTGTGGAMLPLAAEVRDDLVDLVCDELGGVEQGRFDDLLVRFCGRYVSKHRSRLTRSVVPWLGDTVHYLAHGAAIRAELEAAVAAASEPVYLVGHSLGGVACVDLLIERPLPQVELLLTVGSQAPHLYELDALPNLRFAQPLPKHVPRWVNVYDPGDPLSFVGEGPGLFTGGVADRMISSGTPFPEVHRAYFSSDRFYGLLDEVLP